MPIEVGPLREAILTFTAVWVSADVSILLLVVVPDPSASELATVSAFVALLPAAAVSSEAFAMALMHPVKVKTANIVTVQNIVNTIFFIF